MTRWLVVGLGNPGDRYQKTRHNAGFLVVDEIAKSADLKWQERGRLEGQIVESKNYILLKPQTFMNASGVSIQKAIHFYKIKLKNLIVIHDDLDLPLDQAKVSWAKGPHAHNGMLSVEQQLGTQDFWRIRVGVESRTPEERRIISGERFVLKKLKYEDNKLLVVGISKAQLAVADIMKGRYASTG